VCLGGWYLPEDLLEPGAGVVEALLAAQVEGQDAAAGAPEVGLGDAPELLLPGRVPAVESIGHSMQPRYVTIRCRCALFTACRRVHVEGEVLLEDAVLLVDEVDPDGGLVLVRELACGRWARRVQPLAQLGCG